MAAKALAVARPYVVDPTKLVRLSSGAKAFIVLFVLALYFLLSTLMALLTLPKMLSPKNHLKQLMSVYKN